MTDLNTAYTHVKSPVELRVDEICAEVREVIYERALTHATGPTLSVRDIDQACGELFWKHELGQQILNLLT